jgi:hypothetical protein
MRVFFFDGFVSVEEEDPHPTDIRSAMPPAWPKQRGALFT